MLKELTKTTQEITFEAAYNRFENDLEMAQGAEGLGEIRALRNGYTLETLSVVNPPGQACARRYRVNTSLFTIEVSNSLSAPNGYTETFTLCLASGTVSNYRKLV